MAITKCTNCGQDISDQAKKCVHCGQKITVKVLCPECKEEINENLKQCPKCGYKFHNTVNKKVIGIIAVAVVLAAVVGIFSKKSLSLSDEEKAVKISIQELDIADEEIITCLLLDSDDEYYIYFKTTKDEYMTHIVDNTVESKCDKSEARKSGLTGSKAASEFTWSDYLGRDSWTIISHDTLKKVQ